jgi:hypothetical protein
MVPRGLFGGDDFGGLSLLTLPLPETLSNNSEPAICASENMVNSILIFLAVGYTSYYNDYIFLRNIP